MVKGLLRPNHHPVGLGFQPQHVARFPVADTQPATLPNGEGLDAPVPAHLLPFLVDDRAGDGRHPSLQEGPVVAKGHEADVLAIRLPGDAEPGIFRHLPDGVFRVSAHRHQRAGQLRLPHAEEDIGLVFAVVHGLLQHHPVRGALNDGVVAGGDVIRLQRHRPGHQEIELDLVVARDAGVGGAAVLVLGAEVVDNVGLELLLNVEDVVRDAQPAANRPGVDHIANGAATLIVLGKVGVLQAVQLHGHTHDLVALLLEQQGSNRRVHPAAHGDGHLLHHRPAHLYRQPSIAKVEGSTERRDGAITRAIHELTV